MVRARDLDAQAIVAGNELGQELVQTRLEDGAHVTFRQQAPGLVRDRLAAVAAAVEAAELVERRHDLLVAEMQRARHLLAQHQELGDEPRPVAAVVIEPAIGAVRRHRAQDRRPLLLSSSLPTSLGCGRRM